MVSRGHLGALIKLKLLTGKGVKHREIDICGQVKYVGSHKSTALLGFHHFTGANWGGKFVGLSKKTWMTVFLSLDDNDPIVETISRHGEGHIVMSTDDVNETTPAMPASVKSLETFARCMFRKSSTGSYPILRAKCFALPLAH